MDMERERDIRTAAYYRIKVDERREETVEGPDDGRRLPNDALEIIVVSIRHLLCVPAFIFFSLYFPILREK